MKHVISLDEKLIRYMNCFYNLNDIFWSKPFQQFFNQCKFLKKM